MLIHIMTTHLFTELAMPIVSMFYGIIVRMLQD